MIRISLFSVLMALSACTTVAPAATEIAEASVCDDIWTLDTVTVQPGRLAEATEYYETAWLPARVIAKAEGAIKDYHLLHSKQDGEPEFQLLTVYEDEQQFAGAEDAFQAIFQRLELPRPLLINGLKRSDFIADTIGANDYRFLQSEKGPC